MDENHNHKYKRVHVDGKVKLKSPPEEEDKLADEFVRMVINLINNAKTVDSNFVLVSRVEGKHPWISLASQVDFNHAILGRHVTTASNVEFKRQKPWGNIRSCDDDGLINPSAAFTLAWNCDVPPAEIIDGIRTEFQKMGGGGVSSSGLKSCTPSRLSVQPGCSRHISPTLLIRGSIN